MLVDGSSVEPGSELRTRVAIVGGGAVGISLAREFAQHRIECVVLESGGLEIESRIQALYEGRVEGPLASNYLSASRLRYFGGTTNHWGGNCRPLDPIDFERRAWIPDSGWPLSRADLDPYYRRAAPICQIAPFPNPLGELPGLSHPPLPMHDSADLRNTTFHRGPPTRFGQRYRQDLEDAGSVRVLLHATALGINPSPDGSRVESIRVASRPGREFTVKADVVVLALGAIENARLLLLSATRAGPHEHGVGNHHGLVGRYFAEHAVLRKAAMGVFWRPKDALNLYSEAKTYGSMEGRAWGVFSPSDATLRRERLRNCTLLLQSVRPARGGARNVSDVLSVFDRTRSNPGPAGAARAHLTIIFEVGPQPDNRISLDSKLDAYGQRQVRLRWIPTDDDFTSADRHLELFARDLGASGIGRLQIPGRQKTEEVRGNNHHLGTTRMSSDPKKGVVDANCQVHGVHNLYVAGSSVFPTYGYANPTYTIVALALRLADHLRTRTTAGPPPLTPAIAASG